ncbi:Crp/Fnr family transcriptional regulator [Rubrivivax sp. RP6-9]|uniref:Crp/Fnr family transcriptional regulator n=1 Tax=Rubrivivax sp. RP6-9 TaxID=3415750 RepID=UPI003CC63D35
MTGGLFTARCRIPIAPAGRLPEAAATAAWPPADAAGNGLLASLPGEDWRRLQPSFEPMTLPVGAVLHDAGQSLTHAYFPTTAIVSLLHVTASGATAEVAVVGHEGFIGFPLLLGGGPSLSRAVVQGAGDLYRLPSQAIRDEFARAGALTRLLLLSTQALVAQIAQVAVCNRHHTVSQQLCRWLLCRLDRWQGPELAVTHALIAELLGVRREAVTVASLALQSAGLIRYRRGHIRVVDRLGLEACCCECYATVKREYDRLQRLGLMAAPVAAGWPA